MSQYEKNKFKISVCYEDGNYCFTKNEILNLCMSL